MYSKVKIAGHPLHPMLVAFPVACYVATLIAFILYRAQGEPFWFRVAVYANVAGVISAAIAAIPGFIDWAFGIPARTRAKSTGLAHMAFNVASLAVFAINAVMQWPHRLEAAPEAGTAVALSLIGVLLMLAAGFLGWTLVQKHHVGVDLTPEQERLEPKPGPRPDHTGPVMGPEHRPTR